MAKVKIQGHASGTGILTVTAPNTSTDRTITLPDATGTLLNSDGDGSSLTGISSVTSLDGLSDAKSVGADFGNSLLIGHQTTGTLNAAYYNTGVGIGALDALTSGDSNSALGQNSLTDCSSGSNNTAIGYSALLNAVTDIKNTAVGSGALQEVDGGDSNIGIGWNAGDNITTGNSNIIIGASIDAPISATADNQLNIGNWIKGDTGQITMPSQPAFHATLSANQENLAIYGSRTIEFDTERYDIGSNFNTGTYTFTAPITGKYCLTTSLQISDWQAGANFYGFQIETSNKTYLYYHWLGAGGGSNHSGGGSIAAIADMDANDTAFISVYQHAGSATSDMVYTGCNFSGILIA
jgi:hypothetical protein